MKIDKRHLSLEYLWFYIVISLIYIKLSFSYLIVENNYWTRNFPLNSDVFNFFGVPKSLSNNIEFLLLPLLLLYIISNLRYLGKLKFTFYFSFTLYLYNVVTFFLNDVTFLNSIEFTLKILSPIYLFICMIIFIKKNEVGYEKILIKLFVFCLLLTLVGITFFNVSINRKIVQLPIFFANIHTHSYILTSIFIGVSYLIYLKKKPWTLFLFFIISYSFIHFGYAVRTASLLYLVFILIMLYINNHIFKYIIVQVMVFLPLITLLIVLILDLDLDKISSGRLTMYGDKFELLGSYTFIEILFGRGFGSDLIVTEKWWWDEKGSHSDYITYVIENGIFYLLTFLVVILSLIRINRKTNLIIISLVFGYLLTSLISNGIAVRPLAGYVFFMGLAFIYMSIYESNNLRSENVGEL